LPAAANTESAIANRTTGVPRTINRSTNTGHFYHHLLLTVSHKPPDFVRTFSTLIANAQFPANLLHTGHSLFFDGCSNLIVRDLITDADIHNHLSSDKKCRVLEPGLMIIQMITIINKCPAV
jgi:hypothetical protein